MLQVASYTAELQYVEEWEGQNMRACALLATATPIFLQRRMTHHVQAMVTSGGHTLSDCYLYIRRIFVYILTLIWRSFSYNTYEALGLLAILMDVPKLKMSAIIVCRPDYKSVLVRRFDCCIAWFRHVEKCADVPDRD